MTRQPFTQEVVRIVAGIAPGTVATYGGIAALAGNPRAARQVARILHSCSGKDGLPWHRVVNSRGGISLPPGQGGDLQRQRLEAEGVVFDASGRIDLSRFGTPS